MTKVTIVGSGEVGSTIAYSLLMKDLVDELVLIDQNDKVTNAVINDLQFGISSNHCTIKKGEFKDVKDSDFIIITAGRKRNIGESRRDLSSDNVKICHTIALQIKKYYNKGLIIVVSNPVDLITTEFANTLELRKGIVFGTGCLLDTSRFRFVLSDYLKTDVDNINAYVIGEHGDGELFLWEYVTVCGVPLEEFTSKNSIEFNQNIKQNIEDVVKNMGMSIIQSKGKTTFGIATCVSWLIERMVDGEVVTVPLSFPLNGQYGIDNVSMSLLCNASKNGIVNTIEIPLNQIEVFNLRSIAKELGGL